jgi:Methyltransferase domain
MTSPVDGSTASRMNGRVIPRPEGALPDRVGYSLANVHELLFGCLAAAEVESVAEVGAFEGVLTAALLEWADSRDVAVTAIDPDPMPALRELALRRPSLTLVEATSHDALRNLPRHDAVIVDGDHNYFTVARELRLIAERAPGEELPLLVFHDVGWPHARRDSYYDPERIPPEHRQPLVKNAFLDPAEPGVAAGGLRYDWGAAAEGGPRNGVLTAVEDFVGPRDDLRLAVLPAFFGFGLVWHLDAPWSDRIAELIDPWDRNPLIGRLEANRVEHLVEAQRLRRELDLERDRRRRMEALLRAMLASSAFTVGERLSRLRQRGRPVFSREQVREALADTDGRK